MRWEGELEKAKKTAERRRNAAKKTALKFHTPDDVIERLPVVPYVPFRCPKCGGVPRTYGRSGKTRYHHCPSCRINYLSRECNAGDVEGFTDSASLN